MPVFNWSKTAPQDGKPSTNSNSNTSDLHNLLHSQLLTSITQPHASHSQPSSRNQSRTSSPHAIDGRMRLGAKHRSESYERSPTSSSRASKSPHSKPYKGLNKLNMVVESPPVVLLGPPETSTGALFSGRLVVTVDAAPKITLDTCVMQLMQTVTTKHPVSNSCPDCTTKTTELNTWTFAREPRTLKYGTHEYPISYLIPGNLPATTIGHLAALEYFWVAKATTRHGEEISFRQPLKIVRAIIPAADKNSLRIFPPTNLTAHIVMAPLIHPIGKDNVLMRLSGVCDKKVDSKKDIQHRWRLRKMTWRIEETEKMLSPACAKHEHKVSGADGKGNAHEEVRGLGGDELREGWKTDFDSGTIELEFQISCSSPPLCDVVATNTGLGVTHALIIELVVAEEWAPNKKPQASTPTGAARVLRMQFQVTVTERSGMGISWDEEQPPMYEDVPESPPLYKLSTSLKDYTGPPLEEMERLNLGEPTRPRPTHLR